MINRIIVPQPELSVSENSSPLFLDSSPTKKNYYDQLNHESKQLWVVSPRNIFTNQNQLWLLSC